MRVVLNVCFAAAVIACGGHQLDLGGDAGGASSGSSASSSGSAVSSPLNGTWQGYIESFQFADGSDTLAMTLAVQPDGSVKGTVVFGSKPSPPPPTNPDVGYPPGADLLGMGVAQPGFFGEGFPYTAEKTSLDGGRLELGVPPAGRGHE